MKIEIHQKDESISWEELTKLFHEAFQERLDQGLNFTCSFFTPEDLEQRGGENVILVAKDKDNGALVGAAMVGIVKDRRGTWGDLTNMAISPEFKRCGIGSKLEQARIDVAKSNGCTFVLSDTAVDATSSVQWHLKNGFKIVKLHSYTTTNYYSYIFRKQLVPHPLWSNSRFCKLYFWFSSCKCRLINRPNGDYRFPTVMKIIAAVHNKFVK